MRANATESKPGTIDADRVNERFEEAREDMRQLDEALGKMGSARSPQRRLDRAPTPAPTIPIFNPTVLSY